MKTLEPLKLGSMAAVSLTLAFALAAGTSSAAETKKGNTMQLTSTAFKEGKEIPSKYTCDGRDLSPPLKWGDVPAGAKSLALITDDPDAPVGTWVHWVVYDLPATATELPEGVAKAQTVEGGAKQGFNDFKRLGYGGPCPPRGKPHRYFFKLYALDAPLDLKPGATKKEVERAMEKHVLAEANLMGTYQRR